MKLTVLNVAYPLAEVSADAIGGAEQVLSQIDVALTEAGHHSIVIACEGSQVAGTPVLTPRPDGILDDAARSMAWEQHKRAIDDVLQQWPVDLVHMHGMDFEHYLPPPGVPVLVTLHLPPEWYSPSVFQLERPRTYLQCVSQAQQRTCLPGASFVPPIENGVPVGHLETRVSKRNWVMSLGRICPEKGFHLALDAAHRARVPFLLGGRVYRYPAHEQYYYKEIRPRLDCARRYIGPVGLARKRRLLASAQALLVPSLAPETSSLVAMEALACGTPVIAFPAGALADIVEHGKTGFLVHDEREMADAIHKAKSLDPEVCRQTARERFSADRMLAQYLKLYEKLCWSDSLANAPSLDGALAT